MYDTSSLFSTLEQEAPKAEPQKVCTRLKNDTVRITRRPANGDYRFYFSEQISEKLKSFSYCQLVENPFTKELYLIFNNENAGKKLSSSKTGQNVMLLSKQYAAIALPGDIPDGQKLVEDFDLTVTAKQTDANCLVVAFTGA